MTITDDELARIGMLQAPENKKELYDIDESLIYQKPRKEKLVTESRSKMKDDKNYSNLHPGAGSNCFAVHGSLTEKGKPILACDPHLQKTMLSTWYLTRLSWNATDEATGEEYKTYMIGGSVPGLIFFTHMRSPFASFGVTASNPDVMDIFVESVKEKDGRQMFLDASDQTYKEFEITEETIKVRLGSDVTIQVKHTSNGVVIPPTILDDIANSLSPYLPREVVPTAEEQEDGKVYALAFVLDPMVQKKHFDEYQTSMNTVKLIKLSCEKGPGLQDGNAFVKVAR